MFLDRDCMQQRHRARYCHGGNSLYSYSQQEEGKQAKDEDKAKEGGAAKSPVVLLLNLVDAAELDENLGEEVRSECSKFGKVRDPYLFHPATHTQMHSLTYTLGQVSKCVCYTELWCRWCACIYTRQTTRSKCECSSLSKVQTRLPKRSPR